MPDIHDLTEALDELRSLSLVDSVAYRWLSRPSVQIVIEAAEKWAGLEAEVENGARVVVHYPCEHGEFGGHGTDDRPLVGCAGGGGRVILGGDQ